MKVSVVVPTYRRPALLARCLGMLVAQDFDPDEYEIIVVDDAAEADAERLAGRFASACGRPSIRYVAVTGSHGPAAARNAGWRAARSPVIAFTDDDCMPALDWLKKGTAAMTDEVAAVWGRLMMPLSKKNPPTDYELNASQLADSPFVTANCFCRRAALEAVGGFDERFKRAWREDTDLEFSLRESDFCIGRAPSALVVHPVRPAPWGISVRQQKNNFYEPLLYKKHPLLYRRTQQPLPRDYYLSVLLFFAAVLSAVAAHSAAAVFFFAAWAAMGAHFALRRLRGASKTASHVAEMILTSLAIPLTAVFWRLRGALAFRVLYV